MDGDGGEGGASSDSGPVVRPGPVSLKREDAPKRLGQFRILGRLGGGGTGVVYRAEDETLRRTVAIKVLPEAGEDPQRRQRFLREARSAAAVAHPNVAVVHQVGEEDGRVYIAMELIEGESLRDRLERGPLDVSTALDLAAQMARGLAAAHEKGIVHRDFKPENVMITTAGTVKLLDFGLAKTDERHEAGGAEAGLVRTETLITTQTGRILGTPQYMSPEQATGEVLDVRSDVFSFGIVLYEMLAGERPFQGATLHLLLVAIVRAVVPPIRRRVPKVDEATETVILKCLARAPEDRFASGAAVAAALAQLRSSESTGPMTAPRPPAPPSRAPRYGLTIVGTVLLVLGGLWLLRHFTGR